MGILNNKFFGSSTSNENFNNNVFFLTTINGMHGSMERFYQAAAMLKGWRGKAELARRMGESSQTLNNWERRGMSPRGMVNAEEKIGCSAVWLKTGKGRVM